MQAQRVAVALALLVVGCDDKKGTADAKTAQAEKPAADSKEKDPAATGPADGALGAKCYANGTCNESLVCLNKICVERTDLPPEGADEPEPEEPEAETPEAETPEAETPEPEPEPEEVPVEAVEEPAKPQSLTEFYTGKFGFGANRVNFGKRSARATIKNDNGRLVLSGSVKKGPFNLKISGTVKPKNKREFVVNGKISGTPDLGFKGVPNKPQTTSGKFTFKATKGRSFWRLYLVNGKDCVCNDNCGNDFCYIDVGPKRD